MTTRRDFLTRAGLSVAAGLLVGDEALEAFARLTHVRKSFPSAGMPSPELWTVTIGNPLDFRGLFVNGAQVPVRLVRDHRLPPDRFEVQSPSITTSGSMRLEARADYRSAFIFTTSAIYSGNPA